MNTKRYPSPLLTVALPLIAWALSIPTHADETVPGTIHFRNGDTLDFLDFEYWRSGSLVLPDEYVAFGSNDPVNDDGSTAVPILFENTLRYVGVDKLRSVVIKEGLAKELPRNVTGPGFALEDVVLEIETSTGITVSGSGYYLYLARVVVGDRLTGENKQVEVPFCREGKIAIDRIVFDSAGTE